MPIVSERPTKSHVQWSRIEFLGKKKDYTEWHARCYQKLQSALWSRRHSKTLRLNCLKAFWETKSVWNGHQRSKADLDTHTHRQKSASWLTISNQQAGQKRNFFFGPALWRWLLGLVYEGTPATSRSRTMCPFERRFHPLCFSSAFLMHSAHPNLLFLRHLEQP